MFSYDETSVPSRHRYLNRGSAVTVMSEEAPSPPPPLSDNGGSGEVEDVTPAPEAAAAAVAELTKVERGKVFLPLYFRGGGAIFFVRMFSSDFHFITVRIKV